MYDKAKLTTEPIVLKLCYCYFEFNYRRYVTLFPKVRLSDHKHSIRMCMPEYTTTSSITTTNNNTDFIYRGANI